MLGDLPHFYVYAANNPSESMLAKRRGYGVLISHNVPPYGRAGLYKGRARPEILTTLLDSTDRVVQQIDSVEYGLTDIQEYYANTGGLKRAAEMQGGK